MHNRRTATPRIAVPRGLAERARQFAAGALAPAVPRDAATVILLRQAAGPEVFLLRRADALEFAPGACVFPGGSVDERDGDPAIGWAGPSPAEFGDLLGTSPGRARALVGAAVRETFEESGVLLAGPPAADLGRDTAVLAADLGQDSAALAGDRRSLLDGSASLGEVLIRRGLVLRADLLTPWARWVTPEASPRRFDTWFFAAALPSAQTAAPTAPSGPGALTAPGESVSGTWLGPAAALEAARAGQITLLPPTAVTLAELAAHQDVASILAQHRAIAPLLPEVVIDDEQAWLAMPPATEYPL
jgi:8-oxo-dGTP pyrophosphatase MutT (NUDIX family)